MRRPGPPRPVLVLFLMSLAGASSPVLASQDTDPDSLWMTARDARTPAWEAALEAPFKVVALPLRAGVEVLHGGVLLAGHLAAHAPPALIRPRIGGFTVGYGASAGGVSGATLSIRADRDVQGDDATRVRFRTVVARRGTRRFTTGILKPLDTAGSRSIELGAGIRTEGAARFHGIGPRSSGAARSYYTEEVTWAGFTLARSLATHGRGELEILYSGVDAHRPGASDGLPLATVFAGDLPAGYGRRSEGTTVAVSFAHDNTLESGRPEGGGIRKLTASWFLPSDGTSTSFITIRGELQQFLPLRHSKRALALRAHVTRERPAGDEPIPFQRLLTNDDPDILRGHPDFRWRGEGLVGLSAEYRWPVWAYSHPGGLGIDAFLAADTGQVFGRTREIAMASMRESYGAGLRLLTAGGFAARAEYAWGEGSQVSRIRGDQVFQYAKAGLYVGRNPLPVR